MTKRITILTGEPTIEVLADMQIDEDGVAGMANWLKLHRPDCMPDGYDDLQYNNDRVASLFPHNQLRRNMDDDNVDGITVKDMLSDNELLVELAGRNCYHSFGIKAGKKSNMEYIANTQSGEVKHASILYHAKMTFFIAGVSRRVSQEMMRNYVGSDRDTEGSPSQESSRFTHHYGFYVAHPYLLQDAPGRGDAMKRWALETQWAHDNYEEFIASEFQNYLIKHTVEPKGLDRKRIYEAAIGRLPWDFETSFVWTTNPAALTKLFIERDNNLADLEFQRFAQKWKKICLERWPNLFPRFMGEARNLEVINSVVPAEPK